MPVISITCCDFTAKFGLGRLHLDGVVRLGRWLVGISAPVGTTNCASATRLAVKPCAGACPRAA
jgi:hypothetical protein